MVVAYLKGILFVWRNKSTTKISDWIPSTSLEYYQSTYVHCLLKGIITYRAEKRKLLYS